MKQLIILLATILTVSCTSTKNTTIKSNIEKEDPASIDNFKEVNTQKRDSDLIKQGIDFVAFGNEPFWILRIDFDKKHAELEQLNEQTHSFKTINDDNNIIEEIEFKGDNIDLRIQAHETNCYDNMSGEGFSYEVIASINGNEMRGCGKYLGESNMAGKINTNLFGTWMLRQLNDTILPSDSKTRLNLDNKFHIGGFSSCNMYNGSYSINKTEIKFKDILMTQMFCANSIEIEYMEALAQSHTYKIEGNKLTIFDKYGELLLTFDM